MGLVRTCFILSVFLLENINVRFDNGVFRPMVGIPTGTNSAPLVACIHVQCYDDFPSYYLRIKKHLSQWYDDLQSCHWRKEIVMYNVDIIQLGNKHIRRYIYAWKQFLNNTRGRRGHGRMVVGFTTTCAISVYHHWCCEFAYRSGRCVQHYVIKFVSNLRQVGGFLRVFRFHPPIKLTATI